VLYLSSATAGADTVISLYALKSRMNICCWDFLPSKKYCHCTLPKQHVLTSHNVTLKCDHMTGVGDVIFIESVEMTTRCNLVIEFTVYSRV
jgi:hypothetical protein